MTDTKDNPESSDSLEAEAVPESPSKEQVTSRTKSSGFPTSSDIDRTIDIADGKTARSNDPIRVVAIGASAGGLEPIEQFFDAMPTDSGLAFVVIQHLSPDFRSMMDQLLARHSTMTILHAEDGMKIEANVVYLNPPRTELTIADGKLRAREHAEPELLNLPIDSFFYSLASDQKERAIGIIMSGTGSDGSRGGKAIREAGGSLIAQEPSSAKFDSMPRAAIERGTASVSALPDAMPELLDRLTTGQAIDPLDVSELDEDNPDKLILSLLQKRYGADFGYYKRSTVGRRIRRRALMNQAYSIENYAEMLKSDTEELEALYCDLLIGVTAFFRDMEAFSEISEKVLPAIASVMSQDRPIRIWAAGCASGEEPYSLGILVSEFARQRGLSLNVKIFATDIHFNSLDAASAGVYPKTSFKHMQPGLIERYFDAIDDNYHVKPSLRKLVVFSPHNLIKDPPFTRMDLVTCRNLLIYLDEIAQKKVLALFHFSLRKDGVLFLGPSETTGDLVNEFETISKKWRIFRKTRDVRLRESTHLLPLSSDDGPYQEKEARLSETRASNFSNITIAAHQRQSLLRAYDKVLEKYAPTSFLIDRDGDLVHVFGKADAYLLVGSGLFSKRLVEILIPELKLIVSAGIERTLASHSLPFQRKTTVSTSDGEDKTVSIGIEKLASDGSHAEHLLVTFKDEVKPEALPLLMEASIDLNQATDQVFYAQRITELERDLKVTEESLQSTIEELETSNEELQATNEELMASNEELQSTNEELHSVNEELYTVSAEHQRKIEELTELTDDMENLLRATDIGTVFLDEELRIRRFTPAAARTFNLVAHDIGRPLQHITYRFDYEGLLSDIQKVRANNLSRQKKIAVDGHNFLLRILPYDSDREDNAGAVLTVIDIHELEQTQRRLTEQQALYEAVVEEQNDIICRYTPGMILTFVNGAYCELVGKTHDELLGKSVLDFVPKEYQDEVKASVATLGPGESNEYERADYGPDGSKRWLHFRRYAEPSSDGRVAEIQAVGRDVTALIDAQTKLESLNTTLKAEQERLDQIYRTTPVMLHSILATGELIEVSDYWCEKMGYDRGEVIGRSVYEFMAPSSASRMEEENVPILFAPGGAVIDIPYTYLRKDGSQMDVRLSAISAPRREHGGLQSFSVVFDVTDQRAAEQALASQNDELIRINENLNQFTHIVSHDLTGPLRAIEHTTNWIEQDTSDESRAEIQEHINRLKDKISHMGGMLADLLEYSRAGSSQHAAENVELEKELSDIFDVIDKFDGMQLVTTSLPDSIQTLRAPLLLVFRNLIENAVKYHDQESGTIAVGASDFGDRWSFFVQDDGPGIDPKFHDKIVQPFRKLERKDKAPGNGMGLALVKKAVESNGGELSIESNPQETPGTRFTFSWPKRRTHALAAE